MYGNQQINTTYIYPNQHNPPLANQHNRVNHHNPPQSTFIRSRWRLNNNVSTVAHHDPNLPPCSPLWLAVKKRKRVCWGWKHERERERPTMTPTYHHVHHYDSLWRREKECVEDENTREREIKKCYYIFFVNSKNENTKH